MISFLILPDDRPPGSRAIIQAMIGMWQQLHRRCTPENARASCRGWWLGTILRRYGTLYQQRQLRAFNSPIRPGTTALGVSDIPGGWSWLNPTVHIHGFLMSAAFLILYPAGLVAMWSGSSMSFKYHWIIQLLASLFVLIGGAIGLIRAHKIDSVHHFIGLTGVVCSNIQIALGWRHHVVFVRIQRRQWASHVGLGAYFFCSAGRTSLPDCFLPVTAGPSSPWLQASSP